MSSKSPVPVFFVTIVCSFLAWVLCVHFFSQEDLGTIIVVPIIISFVVGIWMFLVGLVLRDTIRRRGIFGINFKPVVCPECGTGLRRGITRRSWKEWAYDGWTCHECGLELSQYGRPWKQQPPLAKWAVLAAENANERKRRSQRQEERIRNVKDQTQRGDAS
jgi:hypothetical protein